MVTEPLVSVATLAVWVQEDIPLDDEYAQTVVMAATVAVLSYADKEDEWTVATAPNRIKDIVAGVAKRNWLNPNRLLREGSIGPIGGDSYVAAMAAGMDLTDYEMSEIARLSTGSAPGAGTLGVLQFTTGRGTVEPDELYLYDNAESPLIFASRTKDPYYFPTKD